MWCLMFNVEHYNVISTYIVHSSKFWEVPILGGGVVLTFENHLSIFFVHGGGLWDLSSPAWDWTRATAVKVQSPNHWTAREVPLLVYSNNHMEIKWLTIGIDLPKDILGRSCIVFCLFLPRSKVLVLLWKPKHSAVHVRFTAITRNGALM